MRIEDRLARFGLPPLPRTAWARIDLDALRANLATIRALVGAGVRVEPVVKGDAYGHGAVDVARALAAFGADGLCVATWDEALELRAAGVRLPLLVLWPVPADLALEAAARRIAVPVGDLAQLDRLLAAFSGGARRSRAALRVHLEVETGLGRDGLSPEAVAEAGARIAATPGLRLEGLWTHMQDGADALRTRTQLDRFEAAADRLRAAGLPVARRHVGASAGLLADTIVAYEAVRPGLAIYGLVPDELLDESLRRRPGVPALQSVLSLHARPIRVAELPAGWGISYGPTFVTTRPSRVATLPLGYGDGWSRSLSNRADSLVRGVRAPIVGNVAMDALMVDVTDVPGQPVTIDDEFVLIGGQGRERITVAELARTRLTNSWEVVGGLARRLPRVYDSASGPQGVRTLVSDRGPRTGARS